MNIIFNPPENSENQYIHLMISPLQKAGFNIYPLDNFLSSYRHIQQIQLVHLNWFENIDDSSFFVALKSFFRKLVALIAIKLSRKPLVWTMHNRASHEKGLSFFSRSITYLLMRWANKIIVHSHISIELLKKRSMRIAAKAVYLPHPNFIQVYGPALAPTATKGKRLRLLFIGAVKPYKNIELLLTLAQAYEKEVQLTVAGKPVTSGYQQTLEQMAAQSTNINLQLRFIHDQELPLLLSEADALVLPYDLASSLNSGTVFLAFSYKKTVICPNIGTIMDLKEEKAYVLAYDYETPTQHAFQLSEQIETAIRLKAEQPAIFEQWGEHLFQYVAKTHAPEQIEQQLIEIYKQLIKQ
ncbi:hypothetical protein GCM10023231_03690 [Olivibacter ginsenosidimutans]|uniref:Glycosyl transferase family 1 domain-containing protein n=1 Tax=Olivibacter ginsenosidimutans TaxID=1176537 RepID=A0ABP9AH32_9SPHI